MFPLTQTFRRLARQRLASAAIILGIAVGVALGQAVPMATDALAALGLRTMLRAIPPLGRQIQLVRQTAPFDASMQQHVRDQLGGLLQSDYTVSALPVQQAHGDTPLPIRSVRLRTQAGFADQVVVSEAAAQTAPPQACGAGL